MGFNRPARVPRQGLRDERLTTQAGTTYTAVRTELGLSVTRYWQRLGRLLDDPEAIAYAPVVINRLRRITAR
ncbi:DUF3263 domain-containing protein [Gordonia sp. QH-12]|uniref:DUF3263 domain-containing protein n=1 Tax=Gordonia sp. QH-12 TaxID=1437876 RepID=UPI0009EDC958|nr:DUF3263 domain-containing protein [Gordonia sp. QH-12]